jgi:caffeoyl-CoA O-methyltransferase
MKLVNEKAEAYAQAFTTGLDAVRERLANYTLAHHAHANMLSGHVQGKALEFLSRLLQPSKILEVGTFTGFSALCMVAGLQKEGALHTIELREEDAKLAQEYFDASGHTDQLHLHIGDALDIIPTLQHEWDLIFIDADKVNYINYYELTLPKLKSGGLIIADNVLFHGDVLETPVKGKNAIAIHAFNEHVKNDPRVEQVVLTVRDGLMLIRKL